MSTLQDTDLFVVDRNGTNHQLPNSQMSTLQDTDLFIVERAGVNYKIEAKDVAPGSTGSIDTPVAVLTPLNGAGTNAGQPYKPLSTAITAVGAGGELVYATDTIASVNGNVLTFPTSNNFDKFEVGDVVQGFELAAQSYSLNPGNNWVPYQGDPIYGVDKAFDGSYSTNAQSLEPSATIAFSNIPIGKVGLVTTDSANLDQADLYYEINGTRVSSSDVTSYTSNGRTVREFNTPVVLTSIVQVNNKGNSESLSLFGVTFNRVLLVDGQVIDGNKVSITAIDAAGPTISTDGGSWLGADGSGDSGDGRYMPDQEWSNYLSPSAASVDLGFDGDTATEYLAPGNAASFYLNEDTLINSLEIYGAWTSASTVTVTVGSASDSVTTSATKWYAFPGLNGSTITSVDKLLFNRDRQFNFRALKINGKILVNSSIPGAPGATDITKTVTSDASLTFTSPLELANMVGPLSQVDENGEVKTPVTSTIASVGVGPAWNQSQVWSASGDSTNVGFGTSWVNGFDGDSDTNVVSDENSSITWDNGSKLGTNATLYLTRQSNSNITVTINGSTTNAVGVSWVDLIPKNNQITPLNIGDGIQSFTLGRDGGGDSGFYFNKLEVEGRTLVNTGISGDPGLPLLTFNSPNPDLQYFQPGDNVGTASGFTPVVYTGNGGTQSITGVGFSPDLVWIKCRTTGRDHLLFDTLRGPTNYIKSNLTSEQLSNSSTLTSFGTDGFSLGGDNEVNNGSDNYVAWCWEASDTTVTNNEGTIESQVRSNDNFSVVTFDTPYADVMDTFGHNLNSAPAFVLFKNIDATDSWSVYHKNVGDNGWLTLNTTDALSTSTAPTYSSTSTLMGIRGTRLSGGPKVAYLWAETPGVSNFGEYEGNGSTTGPVIDCGFKPAFILVKGIDANDTDWLIWDSARDLAYGALAANLLDGEPHFGTSNNINVTSTGFQITTVNAVYNSIGQTYIYAAFAGSNPIEVIDVDVAKNQMTVDGGKWSTGTTTPLNSVEVKGYSSLYYIEVDGVILNNLDYATTVTNSAGNAYVSSSKPTTNIFDADLNNFAQNENQAGVLWNASSFNLAYQSIKVQCYLQPSSGDKLFINGVDMGVPEGVLGLFGIDGDGETKVTGPALVASANDVEYLDGNTLGVSGVSGSWRVGLNAQGAEITASAPSPESIQYTSANGDPLTTEFTGVDATLTTRTWTWQVSNAVTGPWSDFATRVDAPGQDGATPLVDRPTLEPNKFYQVKVRYDSNNAEYVESTFNTFKTGDN